MLSSSSSTEFVSPPSSSLLVCDAEGLYRPASADEVLRQARVVLSRRVRRGALFDSPSVVKDYLLVHLAPLEHEVFCVAFLAPAATQTPPLMATSNSPT